jgi:hypothetical protein
MSNAIRGRTRYPGLVNSSLSGVFGPLDIGGCVLWYSADSLSQGNGTGITAITDKSSLHNNGSSTGIYTPTFQTNILNSLPAMRFSGANYLQFTNIVKATATWFVMWKRTNATNNDFILGNVDLYNYLQYNTDWYVYDSTSITVAQPNTSFYLKCCKYDGVNYSRYTNGVAEATQGGANGIDLTALGTSNYVMYGDVTEFLIYDNALSDTNRQIVETYLKNKYLLW